MARYADIDDLIINKSHCDRDGSRFVYCDDIEPTADVVHVVRCENCNNWDTSWESHTGFHYCPMIDGSPDGDFFCAYGERRE
jgi:hypothetical protein